MINEANYDEVVDAMMIAKDFCPHKTGIQTDNYGNERIPACKHSAEECEYKRLLLIEAKLNGGFTWTR